jgi:hypothetical protein
MTGVEIATLSLAAILTCERICACCCTSSYTDEDIQRARRIEATTERIEDQLVPPRQCSIQTFGKSLIKNCPNGLSDTPPPPFRP